MPPVSSAPLLLRAQARRDHQTAEEAEEWLASAVPLLETYFRLEDPTRLEPAERELLAREGVDVGAHELEVRGLVGGQGPAGLDERPVTLLVPILETRAG